MLSLIQSIDELEQEIETKKNSMEKERSKSSEIENEVNELKKKLAVHNKDTNDARKKITSIETSLLDKKLERHGILKAAKIDLVKLPMIVGSMEDITDEDSQIPMTQSTNDPQSTVPNTESLNSVSTQDQSLLFQKEARIKIDYKKLDTEYLNVSDLIRITAYYHKRYKMHSVI